MTHRGGANVQMPGLTHGREKKENPGHEQDRPVPLDQWEFDFNEVGLPELPWKKFLGGLLVLGLVVFVIVGFATNWFESKSDPTPTPPACSNCTDNQVCVDNKCQDCENGTVQDGKCNCKDNYVGPTCTLKCETGNGTWKDGTCNCKLGNWGVDCAIDRSNIMAGTQKLYAVKTNDEVTLQFSDNAPTDSTSDWYVDNEDHCGPFLYVKFGETKWYLSDHTGYAEDKTNYKQYVGLSNTSDDATKMDDLTFTSGRGKSPKLKYQSESGGTVLVYDAPEATDAVMSAAS